MGKINNGMYYYFIFFHNYQWDTQRYDHPSQRFEGRISIIPIHILLYVQKPFLICWCRQREKKCIQGLRFRQHISISHLLSVDDSLNFYRASIKDCQHLKDIFIAMLLPLDKSLTLTSLAYFLVAMFMKIRFQPSKEFSSSM